MTLVGRQKYWEKVIFQILWATPALLSLAHKPTRNLALQFEPVGASEQSSKTAQVEHIAIVSHP